MKIINYNSSTFDKIIYCIFNEWKYNNINILKQKYVNKIKNKELILYSYYEYGFFSIHFNNKKLYICDFYIYENKRNKKHGTRMLKEAINVAKKFNKDIYIETSISLLNFYTKNGFYIYDIKNNYYTLKLNNYEVNYFPYFLVGSFLLLYISKLF
jgi:ribosomal protein S18 acetylase RimI-like enzyme